MKLAVLAILCASSTTTFADSAPSKVTPEAHMAIESWTQCVIDQSKTARDVMDEPESIANFALNMCIEHQVLTEKVLRQDENVGMFAPILIQSFRTKARDALLGRSPRSEGRQTSDQLLVPQTEVAREPENGFRQRDESTGRASQGTFSEIVREPPTDTGSFVAAASPMDDATVARAQAGLKAFGIDGIEVDGVFGPRTRAGVREFQRMFGLRESGEIDDLLFAKMKDIGVINIPEYEQRPMQGTISRFECGDNCYLTIRDSARREQTGLCDAPACGQWSTEQAMPEAFVGRPVVVTVGAGIQSDGEGNYMGEMMAFKDIKFLN